MQPTAATIAAPWLVLAAVDGDDAHPGMDRSSSPKYATAIMRRRIPMRVDTAASAIVNGVHFFGARYSASSKSIAGPPFPAPAM
jgi:hypothetical protein